MSAKMFWAHALKGFTDTLNKGIEDRTKRMDTLIDNGLDAAKRAAPDYAKANAQYKAVKEVQRNMQRDFGLTDDEFVALVDATDITALAENIYATKTYRESNNLGTVDKTDILALVKMPEGFKLPQGMTADQALQQIMGLQTAALEKETNPKSEGAKQRSWASAVKDVLMLDPKMSAEEQLKQMQYMGVNVNQLMQFQALGGVKQDIFPGVSSSTAYSISKDDYTADDMNRTRKNMARSISLGATKFDLTDTTDFANYTTTNDKEQAAELKKQIFDAGVEMSTLERQIIMTARGNDVFAGRVGRSVILDSIATRVDTPEEVATLTESIKSKFAIGIIKGAISENRDLTDEEIDAIITGVPPKKEEPKEEDKPVTPATPESEVPTPDVVAENPEMADTFSNLPKEKQQDIAAQIDNAENKELVAKLLIGSAMPAAVEGPDGAVDTAGEVAQQNIDTIEAFKEAASKVTYEEYKKMDRKERTAAGLPARGIDAAAAFGVINPKSYFKGGADQIDVGKVTEETTDLMVVAPLALKVYRSMEEDFPDMSVLFGEDGKQVIKDWLRLSNIPQNETLVRLIQRQVMVPPATKQGE